MTLYAEKISYLYVYCYNEKIFKLVISWSKDSLICEENYYISGNCLNSLIRFHTINSYYCSLTLGDLGPVYGFQWRHFGAEYTTMNDDYTEKGVDQLKGVIEKIRNNPNDRTIIMCAWNPKGTAD